MSSSKDGVKGKLRAGVMITLLLIAAVVVGAVLVNLNSASQAGNAPAPQVNAPSDAERDAQTLPSPVIPEKVASLDLSGGAAAAGLKPGEKKVLPNGVIVTLNSRHDLSPALRDIPPAPDVANDEPPENPYVQKLNTNPVKDTIVQRFFGPVAMPTPILTFEGISNPTGCGGCAPPDTNGAVGPNNYVQTVNVKFQIWDKSGNSLYGPVNVNTLFSGFGGPCQTQNSGDPVVNYDRAADRWVISQFTSSSPFSQCVAVSQTSDPTGAYYRYEFRESATNLYDYPKMGVWIDGYYMTANVFNLGTGEFLYPAFLAMDRAAMLQGQPATSQEFNPGNYYYAVLPADIDSALLPAPGSREPFLSASGNDTTLRIWNLHVDFTTPTNSRLDGPTNLAAVPWDPNLCGLARNCIPQPTVPASQYLDSLGDHAMFRLAYRNFGSYEAMVTNESVDVGGDQAGVRWYEIRDPNGTPSIYQQGTYAPDSTNRWMGSIAMDRDGNIAVGYSASSTTVFPSIRYAGRLSTDPLGQLGQGETTLFAGSGSQSDPSGRWGDYSDMTIDPSDDCTFWYTNEYYPTTSGRNWHTRIGKFKFDSCGSTTPTPTVTGTPPTSTPVATATNTPVPPPPVCANYTQIIGTNTIITGTQNVGVRCDDCSVLLNLPFPVSIYNQTYTSAYVVSNGVLNFGGSDYPFGNAPLPVPIFNPAILGYWDDLTTNPAGLGVFSSTTGIAPNRIFHLEWRAQVLSTGDPINFEIRLYETPPAGYSSQVDIVYGTDVGDGGLGATIGMQGPGNDYTQFEYNTGGVVPGLDLTYTLPNCPGATATATSVAPTETVTTGATTTAGPTSTPGGATETETATSEATATFAPSPTACTISFSDVPPDNTFYASIQCLACKGIVSGYDDGTFRPNNQVTRGQISKIVSNSVGYTDDPGAQIYTDVPPSNPFYAYINRLTSRGVMGGYDCGLIPQEPCDTQNRPYFRPGAQATRGQISKIISNAAGIADDPGPQIYTDVPPGNPFYDYINRLTNRGVMGGYACGTIPQEPCDAQNRPYFRWGNNTTRGQASKIDANTFFPNCQPTRKQP